LSSLYPAKVDIFHRLQKQANEAMRIIWNKPRVARDRKDAEIASMICELGWQTINQFVFGPFGEAVLFLFKIANNLLPEYLEQLVKFGAEVHRHCTRGADLFARTLRTGKISKSVFF